MLISVVLLNSVFLRVQTKTRPPEQGLSNGLIILVIAIVVGCFAVLWPKYFYPMMFGDPQPHPKYDPEALFMEGPHGREYLRYSLLVRNVTRDNGQ